MSWSRCRFGDVVEVNPKVHLETGVEYPFLPMEDIVGGRKYNPPTQTRIFDKSGGSRFANDDTVLARITPCLENGKASKVKGLLEGVGFGSTEFFVFRAVKDLTNPDFVYYLAVSDIIRQPAIKSMVGASGRQRADKGVVENIIFNLPDLPTQRRIASILSAYDDLIENNNRRIALLEESMRLLYREWFVRLRFPGHEHVRVVDGLPEGWERTSLSHLFSKDQHVVKTGPFGSNLHAHDYRDEGIPLILVKHVLDGHIEEKDLDLVGEHKWNELAEYRLQTGDIIVTRVGRVGDSAFVFDRYSGWFFSGQTLRVRLSKNTKLRPRFLAAHYHLSSFKQHLENSATGSTRLSLNTQLLSSLPIDVPDIITQDLFIELLCPMDSLILNLREQNHKLSEARDLLLPRLMSGEIQV